MLVLRNGFLPLPTVAFDSVRKELQWCLVLALPLFQRQRSSGALVL